MPTNGNLYQLHSTFELPVGTYVEVNGPHDSHGVILNSKPDGVRYLNLIRGVAPRPGEKPKAKF